MSRYTASLALSGVVAAYLALIAGCKTGGSAGSAVKDDPVAAGATQPTVKEIVTLAPCGSGPTCQNSAEDGVVDTCTATDAQGKTVGTGRDLNACAAANALQKNLCRQSLVPANYAVICVQNLSDDNPTTPPKEIVFLAPCGTTPTCQNSADDGAVDTCTAADAQGKTVGTGRDLNSCAAANQLQSNLCRQHLNPASYAVACTKTASTDQ